MHKCKESLTPPLLLLLLLLLLHYYCYYNRDGGSGKRKGKKRLWNLLDYGVKWNEIKDIALPILERYTARTNGSR